MIELELRSGTGSSSAGQWSPQASRLQPDRPQAKSDKTVISLLQIPGLPLVPAQLAVNPYFQGYVLSVTPIHVQYDTSNGGSLPYCTTLELTQLINALGRLGVICLLGTQLFRPPHHLRLSTSHAVPNYCAASSPLRRPGPFSSTFSHRCQRYYGICFRSQFLRRLGALPIRKECGESVISESWIRSLSRNSPSQASV